MLSAEIFRVLYDKDENNENDNDVSSATADAPAAEADDENETAAPAGVIMDDDPDNVAEEAVQPPIPDEDTGGGDFDAADGDEGNFY